MFKSKFLKNNAIYMVGTLISGLLGYAFHFVVSRQISIAQYGELQSLLSISVIFNVFNAALAYFVIRHTAVFASHNDREANRQFANHLIPKIFKFALALTIILIVLSPLFAHILHFSSFSGFAIVSIATFFSTLMVVHVEILRGWRKFFILSMAGVALALVKFASGVSLSNLSPKASTVSLSFLFSAFVGWHLMKRWSQLYVSNPEIDSQRPDWKDKYFSEDNLRKSATRIFVFSLILLLISNADVLLVKYFTSADTAGRYGAFALLGKIILWLALPISSVLLPDACAEGHLGKRPDKKTLLYSYGLTIFIGFSIIIIYYIFPNFIISLFFGKKYIYDTRTLWLFGLMSFLLTLLTFEANLSFAKRDFRVIYFLGAALAIMVAGIAKYHANLSEIVLVFSGAFLAGYIFILILNLYFKSISPHLMGDDRNK
jgi:O-antigen/teichoic acid export membrane protein